MHAGSLHALGLIQMPIYIANSVGFALGFLASFSLQQRYTFEDRLQGRRLNSKAGWTLFIINLVIASLAGAIGGRRLITALPIMPAIVNYLAYYYMTGSRFFARDSKS